MVNSFQPIFLCFENSIHSKRGCVSSYMYPSVFAKITGDNPTFTRSYKTMPVIEANRSKCYHKILPCILFDGTVGVDSCLFQ